MEFPLSDAREFVGIQHEYDELQSCLFNLGREIFYRRKENGFIFSNMDPRISHYTILNDLAPDDLIESDREKYFEIKNLVEGEKQLSDQLKTHNYDKWFSESLHLKNALDKYLAKGPKAKHGDVCAYDIFVFIRHTTTQLIRYYDRIDDSQVRSGHILTKSKKNRLIDLSKQLLTELRDMTDIVSDDSQMNITDSLPDFIETLENTDSSGLAAKKNHGKLNREILIKSLASDFFELYDDIPVEMIVDIVLVVDPEVTERKVYEIVSKVRGFLRIKKQHEYP